MVGEVLKVASDHLQGALKDGLEDFGDVLFHEGPQLVDNDRKQRQHLRFPRVRDVSGIVAEDGVQHLRNKLLGNRLGILGLLHEGLYQAQGNLLDGPHDLHRRRFGRVRPAGGDVCGYQLRVHLVDVQHVHVDEHQLRHVGRAQSLAYGDVGLQYVLHIPNDLLLLQDFRAGTCLLNDLLPGEVWRAHEAHQVLLPPARVAVCRSADRERNSLIERVDLVSFQVLDGGGQAIQQLHDKRLLFPDVENDKLPAALVADLQEGVACHVLHPGMRLMHELKELVDDCLEKLPVRAKETRVLSDHIHDI
mmetsp:Transcript_9954/g.25311  ORF Transcript_9954/g.25311 Transcript_9954/m.25311 type:complete len:305 (+) Transcript_9954:1038-1952(+)